MSLGVFLALQGFPFDVSSGGAADPIAGALRGWTARPVEGRLSGGFDHAPFDPEAANRFLSFRTPVGQRLFELERTVVRGWKREGAPDVGSSSLETRGKILMLWGMPSQAVETFEELRFAERADAEDLSDLAAAYLARATEADGSAADLARALEVSERALALAPALAEARFNRALALQALFLRDAAIQAWGSYLEVDPDSGWAAEARNRLESLRVPGAPVAPPSDHGLPEAASADPRETAARDRLETGITLYQQYRLQDAAKALTAAHSGLAAVASPLVPWAEYYLALCRYQEADYDGSLEWIARVIESTEPAAGRRSEVLGRSLQLAGLIHNIEGRFGEGLAAYQGAARELETQPDRGAWVAVQSSLAEGYERLGDPRTAWLHRYAGLAETAALNAAGRVRFYAEPTSALLDEDLPFAARYFADATVGAAGEARRAAFSVAAYRRRAEVWRALDQSGRALEDLGRALRASAQIDNQTIASITRADVLLTLGELEADRSAGDALAHASEALEIFRATANRSGEPRALRLRARIQRTRGELAAAREDLDRALTLLEEQQREVRGIELRGTFFGEARPVFEEVVALALERGELFGALAAAERAHEAGGLDLWRGREGVRAGGRSRSIEQVRAALRPGTVVLEYFVLPDRLLVGLVRNEGVWVEPVAAGAADLDRLVRGFRRLLVHGDDLESVRAAGTRLYERLLQPVRDRLREGDDLVVVPDGPLHGMPFAALWDVRTGHYLLQDHQILASPSAAYAVEGRPRSASSSIRSAPRMLVVADPEPDPAFPGLPPLPGARQEADSIEALFPGATVLSGVEASPARFLEEAPRHAVVHYGGHAVANPGHPLRSFLALAPEGGPGTGALFARDLAGQHLDGTGLVVLAACRSGDTGSLGGSVGVSSLTGAFLTAGVPMVIGSLWDAEDASTARLFELFYRALRRGEPAPAALRFAQLTVASEGDANTPFAWAAFQAEGSIIDSAVKQEGGSHAR